MKSIDSKAVLALLTEEDISDIVAAFKSIGWSKPESTYLTYLDEQSNNLRSVIVAKVDGKFCGYVTLKYHSDYPDFNAQNIPEISDLNVLPDYRNEGIGTSLILECEKFADERGYRTVGIGVGMTADYGNAQRLYVKLNYVPDGKGLFYKNVSVKYNESVTADDDLVLYLTKTIGD